jgi:hypothetical protein
MFLVRHCIALRYLPPLEQLMGLYQAVGIAANLLDLSHCMVQAEPVLLGGVSDAVLFALHYREGLCRHRGDVFVAVRAGQVSAHLIGVELAEVPEQHRPIDTFATGSQALRTWPQA